MTRIQYCPKCGGTVFADDCYDLQQSIDNVIAFYTGHCIKCQTNFQWEVYYTWSGVSDLEED